MSLRFHLKPVWLYESVSLQDAPRRVASFYR
jgi:hypothetical protein